MEYLKNHLPLKESPQQYETQAKSAIVLLKQYLPHPYPTDNLPLTQQTNVARYARGEDYHLRFQKEMSELAESMKTVFPKEYFSAHTDSHPIMERDLAYKAGLGWFGKNSMMIHPKHGSFFFIGEIVTSLQLESQNPTIPDRCGTCTRCIDACPTDAIIPGERVLNASQCISYLTIEKKGVPEESQRRKIGEWFFGCDICQTVCPWNEKPFQFKKNPEPQQSADLSKHLIEILLSSNKEIQRKYAITPLARARGNGLKRNALIVIANLKLRDCIDAINSMHTENEDLLKLRDWVLVELKS